MILQGSLDRMEWLFSKEIFIYNWWENRNFVWFKRYVIGQVKIIKSYYAWIDIIRFKKIRYTQKDNIIVERARTHHVPNRIFAKNENNSGN